MKKPILAIAAAFLVAAPLCFAHSRQTNPSEKSNRTQNQRGESRINNRVELLTTLLSLTPSQQQQARTIFTNAENQNSGILANLRSERDSLRKAVDSKEPSGVIKQSSDAIGNNVSSLVANVATASEQFQRILTPEQQAKFTKLQSETRGWMGMGFYGPMPLRG